MARPALVQALLLLWLRAGSAVEGRHRSAKEARPDLDECADPGSGSPSCAFHALQVSGYRKSRPARAASEACTVAGPGGCQAIQEKLRCITSREAGGAIGDGLSGGPPCVWYSAAVGGTEGSCAAKKEEAAGHVPALPAATLYTTSLCQDQAFIDYDAVKSIMESLDASDGVPLLVVETRTNASRIQMQGVPGRWQPNLGKGQEWRGFETKCRLARSAMLPMMAQDPKRVVALMDFDVYNGGCSDDELMERYRTVVGASGGAPVVLGGSLVQYPFMVEGVFNYGPLEQRRKSVMEAFGLPEDAVSNRTDGRWGREYRYDNAGFMMGPAEEIVDVCSCILDHGWYVDHFDDQVALHRCLWERSSQITIDYTSSIVLTSMSFPLVMERDAQGRARSLVTNTTQCFVHNDGERSWMRKPDDPWKHWLLSLSRAPA